MNKGSDVFRLRLRAVAVAATVVAAMAGAAVFRADPFLVGVFAAAALVGVWLLYRAAIETARPGQAAMALKEPEERLRAAIENASEGFALYDADDRLVLCNQRLRLLYSRSVDLIRPGASFEDIIRGGAERGEFEDAIGGIEEWVAERLVARQAPRASFELSLGGGQWIQVTERRMPDGGRVDIHSDISERKLIEAELKRSEERFKKSQAFANIGTWDWNIQTGELHWSDRIGPLLGYKFGTLETTYGNFLAAIHPDDRQKVIDAVEACVERGEDYDVEHRVVWPDGTVRWLRETGDVVRDDDGRPLNMLGVILDITAKKTAEEGMRLAKEEADKANRAKTEFLSSMSHELRTPLNAILGFGQMLEFNPKEPLTKAQKSCVDHILEGGHHLLELINEILDLARIESGKVDMMIENTSPRAVCEECLSLVRTMAEDRGIAIALPEAGRETPPVRADHTRFKQILLNLLSNAVKYNRDGGTVSVDFREIGGGMVHISVADTGQGIPRNKHYELFQPFSRLGAESGEVEGTGIGLTITKQLVELMGGRIGFVSEPGKGSTFWVELPVAGEREEEAGGEGPADDRRSELPEIPATILYVEDDKANLELMEMIVSRVPNLDLISASTAEEGLELAGSRRPDVIVMDISLPGMNGIEALGELHRNAETKSIPVIAMTARATRKEIEKGKRVGFFDYLIKPIKVDQAMNVIKDALEARP